MSDQLNAEHELAEFRAAKDEFFGRDAQSPLTAEQKRDFSGLRYFPRNPALQFTLALDRSVPTSTLRMETSTGGQQVYRRAGKVHFDVDGQPAELTVYRGESGALFLPLRDATSGHETYGAGRYLEPELVDDDHVLIDFNYLYNPYCAYNESWSCPVPPRENWLGVPMNAGEKSFHD